MQPKKKTNSKMKKQPIPEDFELSDEEPTTIKLDEEQKVSSKFVTFDCPNCFIKLQLRNEIEINPKGIKCKCNPCSLKHIAYPFRGTDKSHQKTKTKKALTE